MLIVMARDALLRQAQECLLFACIGKRLNVFFRDLILSMAFIAFQFCVLSFQCKTNRCVIERLLVESVDLESPAMMLFVTVEAMFPGKSSVKSAFPFEPSFDLSMTGKTIIVRDRFADRMALRTIVHSLKVCMCNRQFTRRYLPH